MGTINPGKYILLIHDRCWQAWAYHSGRWKKAPRWHAGEDLQHIRSGTIGRQLGHLADDDCEDHHRQEWSDQRPRDADHCLFVANRNIAPCCHLEAHGSATGPANNAVHGDRASITSSCINLTPTFVARTYPSCLARRQRSSLTAPQPPQQYNKIQCRSNVRLFPGADPVSLLDGRAYGHLTLV